YWAQQGRYRYLALPDRIARAGLPKVEVLDMRQVRKRFGVFSPYLKDRIEKTLADDGQVLLFLNRRGFSSFLLCEACGHIPQCGSCDITLTYHLHGQRLKCHYCMFDMPLPPACPKCGHTPFKHHGTGTQRVEEDLNRFFPGVPVVRMDRDSTGRKDAHRTLLREFASGRARILLGTQMIAKGLDFPQVRLVAIITADTSLGLPDFRAAERTFSLLTQVAGRAGRSEGGGEVVLQTWNPEHPAIQMACRHDYHGFYQWDIANRQETGYPPYSHFVKVMFSGESEGVVRQTAETLAAAARTAAAKGMDFLGPAPCPLARVQNRYRWQFLVRGPRVQDIVRLLRTHVEALRGDACQVSLDVDPLSML
ncbi:MAG TPA: primosomal protein N', partial [Candidatus Xenobia bacterium]